MYVVDKSIKIFKILELPNILTMMVCLIQYKSLFVWLDWKQLELYMFVLEGYKL